MAEAKFKVGDVVILRSGGPLMTVTENVLEYTGSGSNSFQGNVNCTWYGNDRFNVLQFSQDILEHENNQSKVVK